MSASTKLRWRRYINDLRHTHEEIDFIKEISEVSSREFQRHYEEYCTKNNIDLKKLNRDNATAIEQAYSKNNIEEEASSPNSGSQMVVYEDSGPDDSEQYADAKADEYKMTKDEQEIHDTFNKVFRKLAMILHPDKMPAVLSAEERKGRIDMFKDAKIALEKKKYFVLLDLALKFEITLPRNYQQQIRWMKKEISSLETVIERERSTYSYMFSECETEEEKDSMVLKFMTQLFGAQVFSN